MSDFSNGVKRYIRARATVEVHFPVDWRDNPDVSCKQCDYYVRATQRCALNHSIVEYPDKYIGSDCPLEFIENEVNENV